MKNGRMIEVNARGIVQISEYGFMVDDADVLKTINEYFNKDGKREDFAGRVKILIIDETEQMKVTNSDELLKEAEDFFKKITAKKPAEDDFLKRMLDDLIKDPIIKEPKTFKKPEFNPYGNDTDKK